MFDHVDAPKTAVVIEDDPDVRHLLTEVLEAAGFTVVAVGNGIDGVRAALAYQPLLTTVDVNMPGIDGVEAARRIRAGSDTYILMITALDDEADVVLGLSAGADGYINKPFRPRELRARIDALLRRPRNTAQNTRQPSQFGGAAAGWPPAQPGVFHGEQPLLGSAATPASAPYPSVSLPSAPAPYSQVPAPGQAYAVPGQQPAASPPQPEAEQQQASAAPAEPAKWLTHRDLRLEPAARIVQIDGKEVELTRTEFDLLAALMESKMRVRSKADLTLMLRGESYVTSYLVGEADKRAVEAHMTNLRRKLGDNPTQPRYIETVRGVGYRLTSATSA